MGSAMQYRMSCLPPALVLLTVLLGGCTAEQDDAPVATPMPTTLGGVYSGELPCSNCATIATTLWLRADGRFFMRQRFIDEGDSAAAESAAQDSTTYSLGRWRWDELAGEAVLRGAGPERRLATHDGERLEFRVASPVEHVLTRDASAPAFVDRLTLDGESAVTDKGATFRECLTGLTFTVSESGAYRELRRQHRRMNASGKVALTTIEGHVAASGRLVVDRFVTMKPGTACPGGRP
jgi:hypothetical protein